MRILILTFVVGLVPQTVSAAGHENKLLALCQQIFALTQTQSENCRQLSLEANLQQPALGTLGSNLPAASSNLPNQRSDALDQAYSTLTNSQPAGKAALQPSIGQPNAVQTLPSAQAIALPHSVTNATTSLPSTSHETGTNLPATTEQKTEIDLDLLLAALLQSRAAPEQERMQKTDEMADESKAKFPPELYQSVDAYVSFRNGGSKLSGEALASIDASISALNTSFMSETCLKVVGHSDSVGSSEANRALSLTRARAVAERIRRGINNPARVVSVEASGEDSPLISFESTSPENRRVEIWVKDCET